MPQLSRTAGKDSAKGHARALFLAVELLIGFEHATAVVDVTGHGIHVTSLDETCDRALVIDQRAIKDLGETLVRDLVGKGILPCQMAQVTGALGQLFEQ